DVQEVDVLAVDLGRELWELVEAGLPLAPVVPRAPMLGQFLEIGERDASAPVDTGQFVGPAGAGPAGTQVVEDRLGDLDSERPDLGIGPVAVSHRSLSPLSAWSLCIAGRLTGPGRNKSFYSIIAERNAPF